MEERWWQWEGGFTFLSLSQLVPFSDPNNCHHPLHHIAYLPCNNHQKSYILPMKILIAIFINFMWGRRIKQKIHFFFLNNLKENHPQPIIKILQNNIYKK